MIARIMALIVAGMWVFSAQAATSIKESYAFAVLGEPKYAINSNHFDYVNPAAPKGGDVTLSAIGTFDNFNRFALRGNPAIRTDAICDPLFATSDDEPGSYYPLVAEMARYASDFSWVEVQINPKAQFYDGSAITARDVAFTFNMLMTQGVPQFRLYYKGVTARAISRLTVRFAFPHPNKEMMLGLFSLPVMPEKFWRHHKLSDPLAEPPLGSGPYKISDWKMGQYIVWSRVKDYWAANLMVNRGRWNFDTLRYDYYLDDNVAFEAFKAGAVDFRTESSPKNWATRYSGSNFNQGYIVKEDNPDQAAPDTRWLAFNLQRPIFADRRVRAAITLAFDFDWMNKALFYGAYSRANSYFQNTEYAARNYPDAAELTLLAPYKTQLPPEVFSQIYQPPVSKGDGFDRENLLKALALLKAAGYELRQQRLVNSQTGEPVNIELLLDAGANNPWALAFSHNLARLGITLSIRQVDNSQLLNRLRKCDFDMMPSVYQARPWPSSDLQVTWASQYLNSSWNTPGVQNPVVDALIDKIIAAQGNKPQLVTLGRALDRVLTWNNYMIPMWYMSRDRLAYWNKFSHPVIRPVYASGFDNWWFDVNKAATLPADRR